MGSGSVMVNGGVYINNDGIETFLKNIKDISDSFDNIQKRIKKVKNSLENDFDGITPTIIDYAQVCVDLSDKLKKNADYIHTKSKKIVKIADDAEINALAQFDALEAIKQRIAALLASVGSFVTPFYALGAGVGLGSVIGGLLGGGSGNSSYGGSSQGGGDNVNYNSIDEKFLANYNAIKEPIDFFNNIGDILELADDFKLGKYTLLAELASNASDCVSNLKPISKISSGIKNINKSLPFITAAPYIAEGIFYAFDDCIQNPDKSFGACLLASEFGVANDWLSDKYWLKELPNLWNDSNSLKDLASSSVSAPLAGVAIVTSTIKFADNITNNMEAYDTYGEQAFASLKENICDAIPLVGGIIDDCIPTDKVVELAKDTGVTETLDWYGDNVLTPQWEKLEIEKVAFAFDDAVNEFNNADGFWEKTAAVAAGAADVTYQTMMSPIRYGVNSVKGAIDLIGGLFD